MKHNFDVLESTMFLLTALLFAGELSTVGCNFKKLCNANLSYPLSFPLLNFAADISCTRYLPFTQGFPSLDAQNSPSIPDFVSSNPVAFIGFAVSARIHYGLNHTTNNQRTELNNSRTNIDDNNNQGSTPQPQVTAKPGEIVWFTVKTQVSTNQQ